MVGDLSVFDDLRIADFGSSIKLADKYEKTSKGIGTPGYIAPEIINAEPHSFAVDIWSLGCLMHVLLFQIPPFWNIDRKVRN